MRILTLLSAALLALARPARAQQEPPPPMPLEPVEFPEYHDLKLSNGAQAIVVENHEQPVVTINLRIKSGSAHDPDGKEGLAAAVAQMLDKGTKDRTAEEIAEGIDFLGASLGTGASDDWTSITLSTTTAFLDEALALMADVVRNPTFPQDEFETERKRVLTSLQLELSQPEAVAERQFIDGVYGSHPYGKQLTVESVKALTPDDLTEFHERNYQPNNALFVVAGDVKPDAIKRSLDKHFEGWKAGSTPTVTMGGAPERSQRTIQFYHKPGSVQAVVTMGHLLPPATDPDWVPLDVALRILGGGSQGWLYRTLREEKGYTYGAYAGGAERNDRGYLRANAEVRNEVADSAMQDMLALLARLSEEPVPASDLDLAKNYITGSFPREIETPQQVAGQIATARLRGLPEDYLETYRSRISEVDAEEVQRVAQEHVRPQDALVVVVGDATQIYDKIAPFGEIELYDVEGNPITKADLEVKAAEVALDASAIEPMTLVSSINVQGNPVGEITTVVSREEAEGGEIIKSSTSGGAMTMTIEAEVTFDAETFAGRKSSMKQAVGPQSTDVDLRLEDGKVVGTVSRPEAEPQQVELEVPEGTLLPGMDDYAIWVMDLSEGDEIEIPAFNGQSASVYTMTIKVVGDTTVTVPAGEFEAYELEVGGGQGNSTVWARKVAPHIILRQDVAGQPVSIQLKEIRE
jgi:predicted Zn-dependent peptidase